MEQITFEHKGRTIDLSPSDGTFAIDGVNRSFSSLAAARKWIDTHKTVPIILGMNTRGEQLQITRALRQTEAWRTREYESAQGYRVVAPLAWDPRLATALAELVKIEQAMWDRHREERHELDVSRQALLRAAPALDYDAELKKAIAAQEAADAAG